MKICRVSRYVFDVFGGVGWENWSRIRKFPWGYKVVNGMYLNKEAMTASVNAIEETVQQQTGY